MLVDKRGWILAVGAIALVVVGLVVWWRDAGDGPGTHASGSPSTVSAEPGDSVAFAGDAGVASGASSHGHAPRFGDGGVARVAPLVAPPHSSEGPSEPVVRDVVPRGTDETRSAGWRLGRARRRIAILTPRVERFQGMVDRLEADGQPEAATAQRAVLDRFRARIETLREEETQLLAEAEAEGSMDEVEEGFEQGESDHSGPRRAAP